tara:strand:+ start:1619 stop:1849 length:231 start_codon:yes stop_codon:yes gene_type:complete
MLNIITIREGVFKIKYVNATVGIVEQIIQYGNVMYYCHFYGVSAVYNTKADAISHLLWKTAGLSILKADKISIENC